MKSQTAQKYFRKHIAFPQDHGSWVFLFSPLLIGIFAGGRWTAAMGYLIVAALGAFLLRQPVVMAVKAYSGRRSRKELPAARLWMVVYALVSAGALAGLIVQGYAYVLGLAVPGIFVFIWHLRLVSRRAERRQMGVEIVGSGALALAATGAYWVGVGEPAPLGWWLWVLTWFQSAASIVYAFLRLEQRVLRQIPSPAMRLHMARRAFLYSTFNLLAAAGLAFANILPPLIWLPYALQWAETVWGALRPAVGVRPTRIGVRQLIVSTIFTIVFIVIWGGNS